MRVYGPNASTSTAAKSAVRRAGESTFSLPDMPSASEARPAHAPTSLTGIDALMALQGVEDATERRRRAVARGRNALDILDEIKIGLLAGTLDAGTVARLKSAAADLKGSSGDPGLDAVLAEIELRVEVELAKVGPP
jgi:hypothetical protein